MFVLVIHWKPKQMHLPDAKRGKKWCELVTIGWQNGAKIFKPIADRSNAKQNQVCITFHIQVKTLSRHMMRNKRKYSTVHDFVLKSHEMFPPLTVKEMDILNIVVCDWKCLTTRFRYMVTEIGARDLGDQQRYNMLEVSETGCSIVGTLKFGWHTKSTCWGDSERLWSWFRS